MAGGAVSTVSGGAGGGGRRPGGVRWCAADSSSGKAAQALNRQIVAQLQGAELNVPYP